MKDPRRFRFDIRQAGRQILLGLAALAALNAGFYFLYTRPAVAEYVNLLEVSRGGFDAVRAREEQVEWLEGFRDGLQQAEDDLGYLREDVLSTRQRRLVAVQREIADLAREFKIDLDSVSYTNDLWLDEEVDRLGISVPLEGGYANLRKFLQAIEKSEKFLVVERVALARGKQGGRLLDLSISLATYFTAPEELIREGRRRRS